MLAGPAPQFPEPMEQRINIYLNGYPVEDMSAPEESIPQNIEVPPNAEAAQIIPNHADLSPINLTCYIN